MEKITVETWKTFVPDDMNNEIDVEIHDTNGVTHTITMRKYITLEQRSEMLGRMCKMCCSDGDFYPMLMDFAYGMYLIAYYTNIDCTCSVDEMNMLMCGTDIIQVVEKNIYDGDRDIYTELSDDIDARMKHTDRFFYELSGGINDAAEVFGQNGITLKNFLTSITDDLTDKQG